MKSKPQKTKRRKSKRRVLFVEEVARNVGLAPVSIYRAVALRRNGHCLGENFVYALSIPFDIDNSSDNPEDWIIPEAIASRLKELGINFWMVASRNHMLPKEKDGVVSSARPRFHVYLILAAPLYDPNKYVRYCEWCTRTFNSDPQVKSRAQKMYGYGNNPNVFIESWNEGRCIDEVLTDADIAIVVAPAVFAPKQKTSAASSTTSFRGGNSPFDWFVDSGECWKHLGDLEALGWVFFEKNGVLYFQTPNGDHSPDKQERD